jgi:hypothetical protein
MNIKVKFTLILLIFLLFIAMLLSEAITPLKEIGKSKITTYYMYPGENRLIVDEEKEESSVKEVIKIFFNNKDYTRFAEKLLATHPLCFASCRILVFGKEKMVLKNKQWRCDAGNLFIPGEKEVLVIEAIGISFDEDTKILNIRTGNIKHISIVTNL